MMIKLILLICSLLVLANHNIINYEVHAFAATSRRRVRTKTSTGFGSTKGTMKKQRKTQEDAVEKKKDTLVPSSSNLVKETCNRIYSVCLEIQKSPIYQPPRWADLCSIQGETVITTSNVRKGQILTLYPIDVLVLQNDERQILKCDQDNEYYGNFNDEDKQEVLLEEDEPLYPILLGSDPNNKLFLMRSRNKKVIPGWLGGHIKTALDTEDSNCIITPLPGAAPFCAVVASKDIDAGNEVIRNIRPLDLSGELRSIVAKEYSRNVSMLRLQVETACEMADVNPTKTVKKDIDTILGPFHQIDLQYPGLRQIHCNPDIYEVKDFLTTDECDRIISKARPHLFPCFVGDANGKSVQDPWRTNTVANLPRPEVPSIVQKITALSRCNEEQLETLQVLNYKSGQQFKPHTDGMSGPITASGFEQSTRLATVFCYLNNVSEGGSTRFPQIDLVIKPTKGTAVIHFPVDLDMREDTRTLHQGSPALDEKWLLTTWVWKTKRVDGAFSESKLTSLSNDII